MRQNNTSSFDAKNSTVVTSNKNKITLRELIAGIGIMGIFGIPAISENFGTFEFILYLAACSILIYVGGAFNFQPKSNR